MTGAPGRALLPDGVRAYRRTPVFDQETMPAALRRKHNTRVGVWGLITVVEGRLRLTLLDNGAETVLDAAAPGLVVPEQPHRVEPLGKVRFFIEFCAVPEAPKHTSAAS